MDAISEQLTASIMPTKFLPPFLLLIVSVCLPLLSLRVLYALETCHGNPAH